MPDPINPTHRTDSEAPILGERIEVGPPSDNLGGTDGFVSNQQPASSGRQVGKIGFSLAVRSFLNGFISPVISLLKNPLAWALLIGGGLLAALVPVTVPIMFVFGLIVSSGYLAKGITNAIIAGINDDGERFANAFENIGTGAIGILLARISVGRAARNAITAKDRAAFPIFLPPPKSNYYEICTLFTTKSGWKAIGTAFRYPKGIKLSLGTIKSNLRWLIFNRPGTPCSAFYGWKHWFGNWMGLFGMFLPALNQPCSFDVPEQVF